MNDNIYSSIAGVYDLLNDGIDYGAWADFISETVKKYSGFPVKLMLDLGCGTGKMTFALRERGYDMTGVDISPEMLAEAEEICREKNIGDILWLCQDMTEFELYGTVDAAVCCLDGINHLTGAGQAEKCLSLVHNYLVPNGIFIFDLNTPKKFREVYGQRDYILEDDGVLLAWQNDYNEKTKICDFYITKFSELPDGTYAREDSRQRERCYTERSIKNLLSKTGFELLFISSDFSDRAALPDADRWYVAARCVKD